MILDTQKLEAAGFTWTVWIQPINVDVEPCYLLTCKETDTAITCDRREDGLEKMKTALTRLVEFAREHNRLPDIFLSQPAPAQRDAGEEGR